MEVFRLSFSLSVNQLSENDDAISETVWYTMNHKHNGDGMEQNTNFVCTLIRVLRIFFLLQRQDLLQVCFFLLHLHFNKQLCPF